MCHSVLLMCFDSVGYLLAQVDPQYAVTVTKNYLLPGIW